MIGSKELQVLNGASQQAVNSYSGAGKQNKGTISLLVLPH